MCIPSHPSLCPRYVIYGIIICLNAAVAIPLNLHNSVILSETPRMTSKVHTGTNASQRPALLRTLIPRPRPTDNDRKIPPRRRTLWRGHALAGVSRLALCHGVDGVVCVVQVAVHGVGDWG